MQSYWRKYPLPQVTGTKTGYLIFAAGNIYIDQLYEGRQIFVTICCNYYNYY
jgi:hypothetical protein